MASYRVETDRKIQKQIRRLPGNVRQRVIRALRGLRQSPRPAESRPLDSRKAEIDLQPSTELRRIRIEAWRIVYLIEDEDELVSVLGIRKRPPYRYEDLKEALARISR